MAKRIRLICVKGAGFFYSGGMDKIAADNNRVIGCLATSHLYGIFFMYTNRSSLARIAIEAIDKGEDLGLAGNSMGGDALGRILYDVKQARPDYVFPFAYYIDPTPLVWNVENNVALVVNSYNTRVAQLGGGRVRPQPGNIRTKIVYEPHNQPHVAMDDLPSIHKQIADSVRKVIA